MSSTFSIKLYRVKHECLCSKTVTHPGYSAPSHLLTFPDSFFTGIEGYGAPINTTIEGAGTVPLVYSNISCLFSIQYYYGIEPI
jgi:hypothetical protein